MRLWRFSGSVLNQHTLPKFLELAGATGLEPDPGQTYVPIFEPRLRFAREVPVIFGLEKLRKRDGHTDLRSVVGPTRLHQRDPDTWIMAQGATPAHIRRSQRRR